MQQDELRRIAADAGLPNLEGKHLESFASALKTNREQAKALPKDLHWSEESTLVFQLPASVAGGKK
ncbi:MAG: hypothetical protein ABWZ74_06760 [Hyphomicrobiaceae bacterium]